MDRQLSSLDSAARNELGRDGCDHVVVEAGLSYRAVLSEDFRHLLEWHDVTKSVFETVAEHLEAHGALLRGGTIVDATLIAASPSTKNKPERRDPGMTWSKKGNQWYSA
jgi:hypothetical protein